MDIGEIKKRYGSCIGLFVSITYRTSINNEKAEAKGELKEITSNGRLVIVHLYNPDIRWEITPDTIITFSSKPIRKKIDLLESEQRVNKFLEENERKKCPFCKKETVSEERCYEELTGDKYKIITQHCPACKKYEKEEKIQIWAERFKSLKIKPLFSMEYVIGQQEKNYIKFVVRRLKPKKYFLDTLPSPIKYKVAFDFGFDYLNFNEPSQADLMKEQKLIEEYKDSFIVFPIFDKHNTARIMNELASYGCIKDDFYFGIKEFDTLLKNILPLWYCIVKSKDEAMAIKKRMNDVLNKGIE